MNIKNRTLFTGDNLDILRGMNSECIDLIYLDPPFNSNKNYSAPIGSEAAGAAFKDTWTLSDVDVAWIGLIADKEPALARVIETAGVAHGKSMQSYLVMMAVRLLELRRILKETGSIYLHCDPTASHYLKMIMDCIFGARHFRNEITWKRTTAHSDGKRYGRNTDTILFVTKSQKYTWNIQYAPYSEKYKARFRRTDPDGRAWQDDNLTAKGLQGGGYQYEYKGAVSLWRVPRRTMEILDQENRLHFTSRGGIRRKRYLDEMPGQLMQALWEDIPAINSRAKERTGYPTQKPLALLERIIRASSNEGGVVLDPFCGCATALVAAERLKRQWVGIDLSQLAARLVISRLQQTADEGALLGGGKLPDVYHRTDIPKRTDTGRLPNYRTHKHELYGKQEGSCAGCKIHFPFRNFTVDHIIPKSRGGTDHIENLQLLCNACNSAKGTMAQATFVALLKQRGIR